MEIISNSYCATKSFILSVIEWRSAATAPYFMAINSAFWWSVFYLDKETQLRLMISLAAGIFGWDILLSPTYERSILFHLLTWPIRSVLRTIGVVMALFSAQYLYRTELEKACWTAYATVVLLIMNPVWQYQQVPQKINRCLYTTCIITKDVAQHFVITPVYSFYKIMEYIVMLRWLTVILEKVKDNLLRIKFAISNTSAALVTTVRARRDSIRNAIIFTLFEIKNSISCKIYEIRNGICKFFIAIKECIFGIFVFCKNAIVNCVVSVRNCAVSFVLAIRNGIAHTITTTKDGIAAIVAAFRGGIFCGLMALKNGIIFGILKLKDCLIRGIIKSKDAVCYAAISTKNYIHEGLTVIRNFLLTSYNSLVKWIEKNILKPIRNAYGASIRFFRYWLYAEWWPSLKSWLILHVGRQLQRLFNYFCFGLVYIFCGYWVDPVGAFLSRYLKLFYAYFKRVVLIPLKIWAKRQLDKTLVCIRKMLHNLAISIRDSILWPFCLLLISLMKQIYAHFHRIILQPIIDALYERYKVGEDYLLIHFLGPACQVFVDHIPDRSPFCDDTDTELADLLPPGFNEDEESDTEGNSDRPSLPSRSLSPFTEDEHDFVHGLKFPTVDTSDSSEDEFSLKPNSKFRKLLRKKLKTHPKDPAPTACSGKVDPIACEAKDGKDNKLKHSSSTSSHSESVTSSSARYAPDDADLRDLDVLDSELENQVKSETVVEIEKSPKPEERRPEGKKQDTDPMKKEEAEADSKEKNATVSNNGLDGGFEMLDK